MLSCPVSISPYDHAWNVTLIFCLWHNTEAHLGHRVITGVRNWRYALIYSLNCIIILLSKCSLSWQYSLALSSSTRGDSVFLAFILSLQHFKEVAKNRRQNPSVSSWKHILRQEICTMSCTTTVSDLVSLHNHINVLIAPWRLAVNARLHKNLFVTIWHICLSRTIS